MPILPQVSNNLYQNIISKFAELSKKQWKTANQHLSFTEYILQIQLFHSTRTRALRNEYFTLKILVTALHNVDNYVLKNERKQTLGAPTATCNPNTSKFSINNLHISLLTDQLRLSRHYVSRTRL